MVTWGDRGACCGGCSGSVVLRWARGWGYYFLVCDWVLLLIFCLVFVSSFCVKGVVVVAGFHMGVSGQAAGRLVKCVARPGKCALVTADGEPVPHFASLDEGERWLAEQEAAHRGGFAGGSGDADDGVRDAFAADSGFVVDAAGRFYRDNGEDVTSVCGADIAQWGSSRDDFVDVIDGGGEYALNADAGGVDTVARVNGGVVEGDFSAEGMFGVRLDEVTGDAEIGDLNGLVEADGTVRQSRITLVSGDASVSRVNADSAIGRVTGGIVRNVLDGGVVEAVGEQGIVVEVGAGGAVGEVSGEGSVQRVKSGGRVDAVVKNAAVGDNAGVIGFVGSPVSPGDIDGGEPGAWLMRNSAGGRVECVRAGGRVKENRGEVESVSSGGMVERLAYGGVVGSLSGRVMVVDGTSARVDAMSGRESAWAEIDSVAYRATEQIGYGRRDKPVVGRLGPYSRVHFESGNARDVLASIGRVDRGALEAGLVDVTFGSGRESLLPLLREREGVSAVE